MACGLRDGLCRNLDEKMCTTQNKVVEITAAQRWLAAQSQWHCVALSWDLFFCSLLSWCCRLQYVCESLGWLPSVEWIEVVQQQCYSERRAGHIAFPKSIETPVWNQSAIELLALKTHPNTHILIFNPGETGLCYFSSLCVYVLQCWIESAIWLSGTSPISPAAEAFYQSTGS